MEELVGGRDRPVGGDAAGWDALLGDVLGVADNPVTALLAAVLAPGDPEERWQLVDRPDTTVTRPDGRLAPPTRPSGQDDGIG